MYLDHFLSSLSLQKNIPSLLTPPPQFRCCGILNCTWRWNVFFKASVLLLSLCACVQGGWCFTDACSGFQKQPVKKDISLKLHTFNFAVFLPPHCLGGSGPQERQIERDVQIRDACLFACTHSLSYKLDVTIVTCHLLMWTSCGLPSSALDCLFLTSLN